MTTAWRLFAYDDNGRLSNIGPRRYVELHGLRLPIVPVDVTEDDIDSPADFLGWLPVGEDTPCLIQPRRLFEMQFPYGSRAEEERGKGRVVGLSIKVSTDCRCIRDQGLGDAEPALALPPDGCPKHDKEKP